MEPHAAQLHATDLPHPASALSHYQLKLHMIVREMELCKAALGEWKLTALQAITANRLIAQLERSVDELGQSVASQRFGGSGEVEKSSVVDQHLEDVCALCDQLMSTIFARREQTPMHA
jgi:hypothetical protein